VRPFVFEDPVISGAAAAAVRKRQCGSGSTEASKRFDVAVRLTTGYGFGKRLDKNSPKRIDGPSFQSTVQVRAIFAGAAQNPHRSYG